MKTKEYHEFDQAGSAAAFLDFTGTGRRLRKTVSFQNYQNQFSNHARARRT